MLTVTRSDFGVAAGTNLATDELHGAVNVLERSRVSGAGVRSEVRRRWGGLAAS
jgi:hypothetical protein